MGKKPTRKLTTLSCTECGSFFQSKRCNAKYCPECRQRIKDSHNKIRYEREKHFLKLLRGEVKIPEKYLVRGDILNGPTRSGNSMEGGYSGFR